MPTFCFCVHIIPITNFLTLSMPLHAQNNAPLVDQYTNVDYGYSVPMPKSSNIRQSEKATAQSSSALGMSRILNSLLALAHC
jgi:hypothetical protein